jgi:hypothetical protein
VAERRLPEISKNGSLEDSKILALFLSDKPIEVAHDAVHDLICERSLYFSGAKGSLRDPTEAPFVFPPVDASPVSIISGGTYAELSHMISSFFSSAIQKFPAVLFHTLHLLLAFKLRTKKIEKSFPCSFSTIQ